jgi:hypothetical protein
MIITGGGNVGIGTTSPSYRLDVNVASNSDALRIQQAGAPRFILNGDGVMTWGAGAASGCLTWDTNIAIVGGLTNNALALYAGASEKVRITTGGNVGIGVTNPANILQIRNGGGTTGYTGNDLVFYNANGQSAFYHDSGGYVYWYSNQAITFYPGASRSVTFSTGGNVGIGSTAPAFTLDVNGNAAIATKLSVGTTYNGFTANIAGTTYIIGASAWVNDGYGYANASSGGTGFFPYSDGTLVFNSVSSEKMRISAAGLVGIGTNNPLFPLDVIGTIRATTIIETSARKYKTNIQPLEPQLNKVLQLQPVTFDWKENKGERPSIGLIADDVIDIYPEFVVKNKQDEIEGIDYSKLTAVLIQSVKELKEIIDLQQKQINALLTK